MDGFTKIDLKAPVEGKKITMARKNRDWYKRRNIQIMAGGGLFLIIFIIFGIVLPVRQIYGQAKKTYVQAKVAFDAIKKQNIALASEEIAQTQQELLKTQKDFDKISYLKFIPLANWYYNDGYHLLRAGVAGINGAQVLVDSLKPYADVLGLKGQGSFVGGSAQQRIETAVRAADKITPRIDDIEKYLTLAREEIDKTDPNHYPPFFGGEKIKNNLAKVKTLADEGISFVQQAKPLIKISPSLLGEPNPKKYLIIFQNDKELRPTGGFMTAYAIFKIEHGVMHVEKSSDIYELDNTIVNKPVAPRPILAYLPKVNTLNLRDTNLSPDFVTSMTTFNDFYKKSGEYQKMDGIIAVDTHALVAAMNILGDMEVGGVRYTTKIDPRCKCPEVIYQLEDYADRPVNHTRENRKGLIGDLMYSIMNKAFSSSPKLYWGPLLQAMIAEMQQKHVLTYVYNQDAQIGIEALNVGGRIQDFTGDYLHINDTNFGGAKSNMYVSESVDQSYKISSDGTITKTIKISYKNPFAPSDCNLERGGLCLNAILRDWLRIYVPKGSILKDSQGSEVKMISYEELGKTVFEGFLTVRPLGATSFSISYILPFKLSAGSSLPLLIQKQPGTDMNPYTITIRDRQTDAFPLATDKMLKLTF